MSDIYITDLPSPERASTDQDRGLEELAILEKTVRHRGGRLELSTGWISSQFENKRARD